VSDVRVLSATGRKPQRGRIDKRRAILNAAFAVFSRQGYAQACVNEIAAEAGVAKPTVYNHLTDKANLFRHAIEAAAATLTAEIMAAIERMADRGDDLRAMLEAVGHELLRCYCDERSWAMRRLLYAEVTRFPDLLDVLPVDGPGVTRALADRLARLCIAGHIRPTDPDQAAEQFISLLTGPVESRSRFGTRPVAEEELRDIARAAVDTFMRAYAASPQHG
jgi:AcrR family transcriptional regulator